MPTLLNQLFFFAHGTARTLLVNAHVASSDLLLKMHRNLVIVLVLAIVVALAVASAFVWYHLAKYRIRQYRGRLTNQTQHADESRQRSPSPALTHASLTNNYRVRFIVKTNPESTVASAPSIANAMTGVSSNQSDLPPRTPNVSPSKPSSQPGDLPKKSPSAPRVAFEETRPMETELRPAALKWNKKKASPARSSPINASSPTKASPTKTDSPVKVSSPIKSSSPTKSERALASPTKSQGSAAGSGSIGLGGGLQLLGGGNYGDMH